MERIRPRSPIRLEQTDRMYPIWVSVIISVTFFVFLGLNLLGLV
jgi:hypothetical protein